MPPSIRPHFGRLLIITVKYEPKTPYVSLHTCVCLNYHTHANTKRAHTCTYNAAATPNFDKIKRYHPLCNSILGFLWEQQAKCWQWGLFDFQFGVNLENIEIAIVAQLAWLHFSFVCCIFYSTGNNTWCLHLHGVHFAECSPFKRTLQASALFVLNDFCMKWANVFPELSETQKWVPNMTISDRIRQVKSPCTFLI